MQLDSTQRQADGPSHRVFSNLDAETRVSVLAVDDDPELLDLTATFLERERDEFTVASTSNVTDALERLESSGEEIDAIVSDYDMPRMNGLEFLGAVRERNEDIPFILFTGKGSEEIASEAISKGVTDYLQKTGSASQYSILANRILNAVEQYRASRKLKRSQEKFSKLVTNSSDVIAIVDESGRFKYVSPAATHTLGYDPDELVGECAFDYMPTEDRRRAMEKFFDAVEDPSMEPTVEFRFSDPDGGWTVVEARGKNLFDDDFIDGFVVNGRDITALKEREKELRQQNEQLENMRKVLSHDLRNPLSVAADSLVLYRETGEEAYLEKVDTSLERIESLVDQVVTIADNDTKIGEKEQVSLERVVRAAWEMVESGPAELHIDDSREFEADPGRLQQVFENLIRNSVEHATGSVEIRVGTTEAGIYLEDDGPGIPEDEREKIFESGYTTKPGNTGFGLNIVRQIVLGHGWDIGVTEGAEGGARFELTGISFRPKIYE